MKLVGERMKLRVGTSLTIIIPLTIIAHQELNQFKPSSNLINEGRNKILFTSRNRSGRMSHQNIFVFSFMPALSPSKLRDVRIDLVFERMSL